jgi:hypothetical protein
MFKSEHGWVSVEGKDAYYQSIREGAPIPLADGQINARADGKRIVVPLRGGRLPRRCVKTNQLVSEDRIRRKMLYSCTPFIYFALLINILVVIILYYVLRKKVVLDLPLSREAQSAVTRNKIVAWSVFAVGLIMIFFGFAAVGGDEGTGIQVVLLGIFMILGALIFAALKAQVLRVVKIRGDNAWLTGAHKDFVASLPPYS